MLKKICLLLGATILLSGCVKIETDLTINKDGSAIVKDRFMMSKQLLAMSGQDPFDEAMKEKASDGKKVEPYETEEMKGFEATTNIINLATDKWNITPDNNSIKTNNKDGKFVSVQRSFLKTVYVIDAEIDATKDAENSSGQANQMQAMKASGMDINNIIQFFYTVNTPVKADSNNATKSDDTKFSYTWQFKFGEVNPMKLKFTVYNTGNIIGAIILLIVIALVGFKFYATKKQ